MHHRHHINPPLSIYKKIALTFIILAVILIGVIFYFTLSYAYITIYPKQEQVKTDFNFVIVEDEKGVNPLTGIFAGKIVDQTFEGEKLLLTTGTKQLAGDIVGKVKITNGLSKNQTLVATTRLLSPDGTLYRLKNKVDVLANGALEAEVYADDSSKPLAKAGTKFTIPGLSETLQKIVFAESLQDFVTSGQSVKAVSQEELDKALADYAEELSQQAVKEEDSGKIKVLNKEIIAKTFDVKPGDEVLNYHLKLKLKVSGVIFDDKDVKVFAQESLASQISADKQSVASNSDSLVYEVEKVDLNNKLAQLKSSINGAAIISLNSPILERDKLVKLSFDEIKAYLENFEQIERVDITFFPSWVKKVPYFQDHIIIEIAQ
ncbi:MAG: hypothetical protein NT116_02285 [Candidatus Parcubacteria bacterium]|nr:hypothetical protein [Candidatus Parcubacteria bacterium]